MDTFDISPVSSNPAREQSQQCPDCNLFYPYAWGILQEGTYRGFTKVEANFCPSCGHRLVGEARSLND